MTFREQLRNEVSLAIRAGLTSVPEHAPKLRVSGSWSTLDAHVSPDRGGALHSFSDIDLISACKLESLQVDALRRVLLLELKRRDLIVSAVSIRSESELSDLPHAATWRRPAAVRPYWRNPAREVHFWSHIAALEAAVILRRHRSEDRAVVASYAVVKYFFTFVRNAALTEGRILASYSELCRWSQQRRPSLPVWEALKVKHGARKILSSRSAESLLSSRALRSLMPMPAGLSEVNAEILQTLTSSVALPAERYASESAALADTPMLQGIAIRQYAKYQLAVAANAQ